MNHIIFIIYALINIRNAFEIIYSNNNFMY
jgi:hypothetical protein